MGLTHQRLAVKSSRKARKAIKVDFLIDSGAVYSLVPGKQLKSLGIDPYKTLDFTLADGSIVTRKVGDAYFEFRGQGGAAPVIFGQDGDQPLLGATTLESLGLALNPFKRELYPMHLILMRLMLVYSSHSNGLRTTTLNRLACLRALRSRRSSVLRRASHRADSAPGQMQRVKPVES